VTTGYYARVVYCTTAIVTCNAYSSDTTQDHIRDSDASTVTAEVWVDEGASIAIGNTNSFTSSGTTSTGGSVVLGSQVVGFGRVAGNDVCRAVAMVNITLGGIPSHTWTYETYGKGFSSAWIEEYPIQTQ